MASKMFENLNAIVANTITNDIKMINIDELHDSDANFFNVEHIEEFADTIQGQGGVKDNLLVRPLSTGGYEIISGHRRKAAIKYLLEKGENVSRYLPCLIQNYDDDDSKMLDLVLMNVSARQISDSELWKSYEIVNEILQRRKEKGEKFGRIREKLAEVLGVSESQVKKLQNIKSNAISDIKDAIDNGSISVCTANEIAKMNVDEQKAIVSNENIKNVKHKSVVQKKGGTCTTPKIPIDNNSMNNSYTNSDFDDGLDGHNTFSQKKGGTCTTLKAPLNDFREIEQYNYTRISSFIDEHYADIEEILESYIDNTDNMDAISIAEDFQNLVFVIKETERDKSRK